jgi:hypothetical protein
MTAQGGVRLLTESGGGVAARPVGPRAQRCPATACREWGGFAPTRVRPAKVFFQGAMGIRPA